MYDDYYYYEEQRKAQAKSDAALAGTFAAGICGGIGIVFSVIMFLISRFDILSSALMALASGMMDSEQGNAYVPYTTLYSPDDSFFALDFL